MSSISQHLGARLVREKEAHDLSRNTELANFQFIGYRTSATAVELVAFCDADDLTERDIVRRRDEFFGLARRLPHEFGLKPRGRNPNGLLGFVFARGCPEHMARFVARQTQISHAANTGAVTVSWAIDAPGRRIHTHDNPVSIFPPVFVLARSVFPGLEYLESLLHQIPPMPETPDTDPATRTDVPVRPEEPGGDRILFLAANPGAALDLEKEFERIETALRLAKVRERVELKQVWAATIDRLMQAMLDEPPTIVHFSGHGTAEGIILRDDGGEAHAVSGEALASLFALFRDSVRCVVLSSCWSEHQAAVIRQHVPHVVGIRAPVYDDVAISFSTGFYRAIAAGRDVPFAFGMGIARVQAAGGGGEDLFVML